MKKLLLSALFLASPAIFAHGDASHALVKFKEIESRHKSDWFDFMKHVHTKKYDLLKSIHKDWVHFGVANIKELDAMSEFTGEAKESFFANKLKAAIALHRKHIAAWKNLHKAQEHESKHLQKKHETELNAFEKRYVR